METIVSRNKEKKLVLFSNYIFYILNNNKNNKKIKKR